MFVGNLAKIRLVVEILVLKDVSKHRIFDMFYINTLRARFWGLSCKYQILERPKAYFYKN